MNSAMKTTFLSEQDLSQVQSILDQHGMTGFDASVRLWGRGKAIEVKGTVGKGELSCLLAIARFLGDDADASAANHDSMPATIDADMPTPTRRRELPATAGLQAS